VRVPVLGPIGRNALLVYLAQHAVREVWEPQPSEPMLFAVGATAVCCAVAWALDRLGVRLRV
jgi:hypothetical protein